MFSRKPKTVASVMQSFTKVIDDLDQIVIDQVNLSNALDEERQTISAKIEVADLEIHQARGISMKLTNLLGLGDPS